MAAHLGVPAAHGADPPLEEAVTEHAPELYDGPSLHQNAVYVCSADGQEWPCRTRLKERIARLTVALREVAADDDPRDGCAHAEAAKEALTAGDGEEE